MTMTLSRCASVRNTLETGTGSMYFVYSYIQLHEEEEDQHQNPVLGLSLGAAPHFHVLFLQFVREKKKEAELQGAHPPSGSRAAS